MAHSRLPFLYPNLLRSVRSCEPTTHWSFRCPPQRTASAAFHSSFKCERESAYHKRYGPAAEAGLRPSKVDGKEPAMKPPKDPKDASPVSEGMEDKEAERAQEQSIQSMKQEKSEPDKTGPSSSSSPPSDSTNEPFFQRIPDNDTEIPESSALVEVGNGLKQSKDAQSNGLGSMYQTTQSGSSQAQDDSKSESEPGTGRQNPRSESDKNQKPPYLSPSPYVHHFDTYTLVKELGKGGFTDQQAISMMKAVRGLLADNLEMARAGLISKSDFENESYLFRAACSELQNSLQTSRNAEIQNQRTKRAQLQHELDILTQRMTQDLTGMKDGIKEMFNDQKISTKELQRSIDTSIQELNYHITVSLNSDGKSEAEGLRWILTRRAALAIATSAGLIILALQLHSYMGKGKEAAKKEAMTVTASTQTTIPETSPETPTDTHQNGGGS